jgi:hypothetical protein
MTHALAPAAPTALVPMLLGGAAQRIPTAGRVRAGIKVLTKRAAEHAKAREIYERGVAAGVSFERIETDITEAIPELKTPLVPKNVPYFTVRGEDFPNPVTAKQIMEAFAEDRGDGVKRLYRFPVVFPSDSWQMVMPHELIAWGANDKKFWSEYAPDGSVRYCRCYAPVPLAGGKRAIRIFGGRKTQSRTENNGVCDPENCREYQERKCNLSGRFIFFIPGIKSLNAFELHTQSFYAMNNAIQRFQMIAFMRGGRISGFLDRQRTTFFLTKKLMEVPHIDEEGRAVRVKQWVIDLEAPIDVTALLRPEDDQELLATRASQAVAVLEGPGVAMDSTQDEREIAPATTGPHDARPVACSTDRPSGADETGKRQGVASEGDSCEAILADAEALGVCTALFEEYATKRWGKGWKLNASGRRRAHDEVRSFAADAQGFRAKVDAEVRVFS